MVKLQLLYLFIINLAYCGIEQCDCGEYGILSKVKNNCLGFPKEGEKGYITDCVKYEENDDGEIVCDLCKENHALKESTKSCIKVTNILQGCLEYYLDGQTARCQKCEEGRFYDDNYHGCIILQNPISNCIVHENPARCVYCDKNYILQTDFSKCRSAPTGNDVIEDCIAYQHDGEGYQCLYCDQKQSTGDSCVAPLSTVQDCWIYFSNRCILCVEGKYHNGNECQNCPAKIKAPEGKGGDGDGNGKKDGENSNGQSILSVGLLVWMVLFQFLI